MDPVAVGTVIGTSVIVALIFATCIYDNCFRKEKIPDQRNPLLVKKRSFKVKNLFNHVEI
jgi:hypothetical protein